MNKRQHEKEILENELATWTEKKFGHLKPHLPMVGIVAGAAVVAVILGLWWWDLSAKNQAVPWRVLNRSVSQTRLVGDARSLELVAEDFPNEPAGLWALQLAADFELRTGIMQYSGDESQRKEGMDKVRKAMKMYRQIVESDVEKSTMLQRRSIFGLAYAAESAGDFEQAQKYYSLLLEQAGDSPFKESAQRGLERVSRPEFKKLFEQFVAYQPPEEGEAPGPQLPDRPDISFPEIPSAGGGDFQPDSDSDATGGDATATGDDASAAGDDGKSSIPAQPVIPMEAFDPKYAPKDDQGDDQATESEKEADKEGDQEEAQGEKSEEADESDQSKNEAEQGTEGDNSDDEDTESDEAEPQSPPETETPDESGEGDDNGAGENGGDEGDGGSGNGNSL